MKKFIPSVALLAAVASVGYLPPLLGAAVVLTLPLTLVAALGAISD